MARTSTCHTSRHAATSIEVRQVRLGEGEHHSVCIRRRLAHRRNIKRSLRFLGKSICRHPNGDITVSLERSYYYSVLKNMGLDDNSNPTSTPSLRRPAAQQDSHLNPDLISPIGATERVPRTTTEKVVFWTVFARTFTSKPTPCKKAFHRGGKCKN